VKELECLMMNAGKEEGEVNFTSHTNTMSNSVVSPIDTTSLEQVCRVPKAVEHEALLVPPCLQI
jgi:hypothetical protein